MRQRTRSFGHNATTDSPSLGRWSTRRILCPISNRPMLNLDQETVATRRMYGIDRDLTDRYGRKCRWPADWSSRLSVLCSLAVTAERL